MKYVKNASLTPKSHREAATLKHAFIQISAMRTSSNDIEVQVETGPELSSPKHKLEPREGAGQQEPSWWFKGKRDSQEQNLTGRLNCSQLATIGTE
jgi:hypothetical protein